MDSIQICFAFSRHVAILQLPTIFSWGAARHARRSSARSLLPTPPVNPPPPTPRPPHPTPTLWGRYFRIGCAAYSYPNSSLRAIPPHLAYATGRSDYVDRGPNGLECICLLLAYKVKYPENFFLLRGNHECASINRIYGFYDECTLLSLLLFISPCPNLAPPAFFRSGFYCAEWPSQASGDMASSCGASFKMFSMSSRSPLSSMRRSSACTRASHPSLIPLSRSTTSCARPTCPTQAK